MSDGPWLLCYDIRDPRRLGRIGSHARRHGLRMQRSIYLLTGSRDEMEDHLEALLDLADPRVDDLRIYPLRADDPPHFLGRPSEIMGGVEAYGEGPAAQRQRWLMLAAGDWAEARDALAQRPAPDEDWPWPRPWEEL